jgi:hypothetical protein
MQWWETKTCYGKGVNKNVVDENMLHKLPYLNTKTLTLNVANLELGEGFRDFSYAYELVGWRRRLPLASPFIGVPWGGWPAMVSGRAASPCGQNSSIMHQSGGGWAKEDVSGEESGKRGSRWPAGQALAYTLPQLSPSPHLVPLMLKPLTKSFKSKAISLHSFPKFLLFIFWNFWFYDMWSWETKTCCGKWVNKNMVDERERDKN